MLVWILMLALRKRRLMARSSRLEMGSKTAKTSVSFQLRCSIQPAMAITVSPSRTRTRTASVTVAATCSTSKISFEIRPPEADLS